MLVPLRGRLQAVGNTQEDLVKARIILVRACIGEVLAADTHFEVGAGNIPTDGNVRAGLAMSTEVVIVEVYFGEVVNAKSAFGKEARMVGSVLEAEEHGNAGFAQLVRRVSSIFA